MGLKIEDTIKGQLNNCNDLHFLVVNNMSKLMTGKVKQCESSDFNVSGLKWRLLIRPSEGLKDHLSFYLWITDEKCIGSNWKVNLSFELSVVPHTGIDNNFRPLKGYHDEKYLLLGLQDFIPYTVLKERSLVNDEAVFCAKMMNVQPSFLNITSIPRTIGTAERIKLNDVPRNNCRFTWKITQFSSFIGEQHSSYEFTVAPRRWKLVMYPNGNGVGKGNSLSLYLQASDYIIDGPKARTMAVHKFRVLDQINRNHFETTQESWFPYDPVGVKSILGYPKWLPLEELHKPSRGLLVKDEIYIGVEFLIVSTSETIYP